MAITLGSYGSGLDVESIVKALVDADIAPKTNSLDRKESDLSAKLSAIGSLKSVLSDLDSSLSGLSDGSVFDEVAIQSPTAVDVVQTGTPSTGQFSLDVDTLAASQVLATAPYSSTASVVGSGNITISVGAPSYADVSAGGEYTGFTAASGKITTLTLDSSNNTVAGLRDAVNAANIGITASIVADGSSTRLLFTADDTGANTAISITTTEASLSGLAHGYTDGGSPAWVSNLTEARVPVDASFKLNGLSLTSSSNVINDLVDGLKVTLKEVTATAGLITTTSDTATIESKMQTFVDSYNSYQTTLTSLMDYQDSAGALAGDSTARRIQSVLRGQTTGTLSISGNTFSSVADLGISSNKSGALTLDKSKLQSALANNIDDAKEFFAGATTTVNLSDNTDSTGLADLLKTSIDVYLNATSGMLTSRENRIDSSLDDIKDDRAVVLARMAALEEKYTKQFTAMDTLVGQLQSTSDFLTQQIDAIKAAANR